MRACVVSGLEQPLKRVVQIALARMMTQPMMAAPMVHSAPIVHQEQVVHRHVPVVHEQTVEVPHVQYQERIVEVPHVQTQEVVRHVPVPIVREREVSAKHQQLISGVSIPAYWVSSLTYDCITYIMPAAIALIIIKGFDIAQFVDVRTRCDSCVASPCLWCVLTYVCVYASQDGTFPAGSMV